MDKLINIIKMAFKNIKANKLRSALTMLGLIIGIASVIVLVGIGSGATSDITNSVQSLGTDILTVSVNSSDTSFEYEELDEFKEILNVKSIAPYKNISATVSRGTTVASSGTILATNGNYLNITNITLYSGRTISEIDIENSTKVCILGNSIATTLFNLSNPVGQEIKLDGDIYIVIGVLNEQGTTLGNNVDNMILLPITAAKYFDEDLSINSLYVQVDDDSIIETTRTLIETYIREKLLISTDYFSVSSQDSMLDTMSSISDTLSLLLGGIASISLIVGGIGVMNVMLVSVTERTKEIGIRKSLGAKKTDILLQFLIESLVLSLLGGLIGVFTGLVIGYVIEYFGLAFTASVGVIILAFGSSACIGMIFGIFPAYRAASLKPIEALRTD